MGSVRVRLSGQRDGPLLGRDGRREPVDHHAEGHRRLLSANHGHEQQPRLAAPQRRPPAERENRLRRERRPVDNLQADVRDARPAESAVVRLTRFGGGDDVGAPVAVVPALVASVGHSTWPMGRALGSWNGPGRIHAGVFLSVFLTRRVFTSFLPTRNRDGGVPQSSLCA